ncbi:MAG: CopG family ribbon-helix-helix protein [Thermodesulfobacteriota bacterium]|nr:CopG family ribbon-helix-helix protein [Thermodesulfobacteriota bacterium]
MTTTTMSLRLPKELSEQLTSLARSTKRTKSFCAVEAIKNYLRQESWQIEAIEEGLENADAGRMIKHEDVNNWVSSWNTSHEKELPRCK